MPVASWRVASATSAGPLDVLTSRVGPTEATVTSRLPSEFGRSTEIPDVAGAVLMGSPQVGRVARPRSEAQGSLRGRSCPRGAPEEMDPVSAVAGSEAVLPLRKTTGVKRPSAGPISRMGPFRTLRFLSMNRSMSVQRRSALGEPTSRWWYRPTCASARAWRRLRRVAPSAVSSQVVRGSADRKR